MLYSGGTGGKMPPSGAFSVPFLRSVAAVAEVGELPRLTASSEIGRYLWSLDAQDVRRKVSPAELPRRDFHLDDKRGLVYGPRLTRTVVLASVSLWGGTTGWKKVAERFPLSITDDGVATIHPQHLAMIKDLMTAVFSPKKDWKPEPGKRGWIWPTCDTITEALRQSASDFGSIVLGEVCVWSAYLLDEVFFLRQSVSIWKRTVFEFEMNRYEEPSDLRKAWLETCLDSALTIFASVDSMTKDQQSAIRAIAIKAGREAGELAYEQRRSQKWMVAMAWPVSLARVLEQARVIARIERAAIAPRVDDGAAAAAALGIEETGSAAGGDFILDEHDLED